MGVWQSATVHDAGGHKYLETPSDNHRIPARPPLLGEGAPFTMPWARTSIKPVAGAAHRGRLESPANYLPTKVPPHPPPASLIWSLTMRADCVEGNAILASIGTLLVAWVFFKVISMVPPERHTDTFPVSHSAPAFLAE
jgi:hypothetical protein